jgi:hypothetical protein
VRDSIFEDVYVGIKTFSDKTSNTGKPRCFCNVLFKLVGWYCLTGWIFPGDDPAEVSKPLAPPPTIVTKEEELKEDTKPKDAISSMMAPPQSRLSTRKRSMGGPPGGMPGGMGSPMMMGGMMTPPAFGGTTTPKFATFTPKAAVFTPKPTSETPVPKEVEEEPTYDETGEQ